MPRLLSILSRLALVPALLLAGCLDAPECGNGVVEGAEECDDGGPRAGDGCSTSCQVEVGYACDEFGCSALCGDGRVVDEEACDPSVSMWEGACSDDCTTILGSCGDGELLSFLEECDDGNETAYDGCSPTCQVDWGYECDTNEPTSCDASSLPVYRTLGSLTYAELYSFCSWYIGALGGPGRVHYCGSLNWTINSVSECRSAIYSQGFGSDSSCTVSDFEQMTARLGTPCRILEYSGAVCD